MGFESFFEWRKGIYRGNRWGESITAHWDMSSKRFLWWNFGDYWNPTFYRPEPTYAFTVFFGRMKTVTHQVITTRSLHDSLDNILFSGCWFTRHVDQSWDTGTSSHGSDHIRICSTIKQMTSQLLTTDTYIINMLSLYKFYIKIFLNVSKIRVTKTTNSTML